MLTPLSYPKAPRPYQDVLLVPGEPLCTIYDNYFNPPYPDPRRRVIQTPNRTTEAIFEVHGEAARVRVFCAGLAKHREGSANPTEISVSFGPVFADQQAARIELKVTYHEDDPRFGPLRDALWAKALP